MKKSVKLRKDFINKNLKPLIETDDLLCALNLLSCVNDYNRQCLGDAISRIHGKYKTCAWIPMAIFRLGYLQALIDIGEEITFDFTHQSPKSINRALEALKLTVREPLSKIVYFSDFTQKAVQ